jgi:AraC-like DNA-binding protein
MGRGGLQARRSSRSVADTDFPGTHTATSRTKASCAPSGDQGQSQGVIRSQAHEAGFFDQSHFTRAFKHFFGITPLAYRRDTRR